MVNNIALCMLTRATKTHLQNTTKSVYMQHSWSTCKNFLASSLITVQNLVGVSHAVCAHVRDPKNMGDAGAPPLGVGCGSPHRNALLHICYHTKFGRSSWDKR